MNRGCFVLAGLVFAGWFCPKLASADALVKFPTGPAAWTVDITQSPSDGPPAKKCITTIAVTQDDSKRRSVITWSTGTVTEKWDLPGQNLVLAEDSSGHAYSVLGGSLGAQVASIPYGASAFSWLKAEMLQEKTPITYGGKLCFHYKGIYRDPRTMSSSNNEAWIDSTTLLPVALDDGESLGKYTFSKDPPPTLTLPPKFANVFDRFEEGMGILKPIPPR